MQLLLSALVSLCHCEWHVEILASVLTCYYHNMLAISHALSPSLESIPSCFLCSNRKMWPPPQVQLDSTFLCSFCLQVMWVLIPTLVFGLHLRTVNACFMWDNAPALSDLVTSNGIDLRGIAETWLTMMETSADLAEMTPLPPPPGPLSFRNLEHSGEGEEWVCSFWLPINLQQSICQPKNVLSLSGNFNASLSSTFIVHLVLLLLSPVSYKIYCPTYLQSPMIWYWWGTSTFMLIPQHLMIDCQLVFWSLFISIKMLIFLPTFTVILLI